MARHLVVGNQTLLSTELAQVLAERVVADQEDCHLHVVVPQTPLDHYRAPIRTPDYRFAPSRSRVQTVADHRLEVALEQFVRLDATVTGEVGDEHPLQAVRAALARDTYDEIILSTFAPGISRWLATGLTGQLARHVDIPVTHVVAHMPDERTEELRRYEEAVRALARRRRPDPRTRAAEQPGTA